MEKPYYQSLMQALKSVDRPGSYATGGKISMPLPGISLKNQPDSIIGLPLCECHVKKLIEVASRVPFGRGTETIVDTLVRCTWQLSPAQFIIIRRRVCKWCYPKWRLSLGAVQRWLLLVSSINSCYMNLEDSLRSVLVWISLCIDIICLWFVSSSIHYQPSIFCVDLGWCFLSFSVSFVSCNHLLS